ncbi:MAG: hypothetical protein J6I53_11010 [Treponema sp.]|nr:hypothetical protein [Treponema sp.]
MKRTVIALALALAISAPVSADLPDTYKSGDPDELNQIDVDAMTEEELKIAYNELRKTYGIVWDLYIEQLSKGLIDADPTSTPAPTSAPAPASGSVWEKMYYVDEFDQPTDDYYMCTTINGTFSNSATTDDALSVVLFMDEDGLRIRLIEYGSNFVKGYHSDGTSYTATVLMPSGEKIKMSCNLDYGSDRLKFNAKANEMLLEALREEKDIKIRIDEEDGISSYLFTIPGAAGFADFYDSLF